MRMIVTAMLSLFVGFFVGSTTISFSQEKVGTFTIQPVTYADGQKQTSPTIPKGWKFVGITGGTTHAVFAFQDKEENIYLLRGGFREDPSSVRYDFKPEVFVLKVK